MSTGISIEFKLPIINGYVIIPGSEVVGPTSITPDRVLDNISGSSVCRLSTNTQGLSAQAPPGDMTAEDIREYESPNRPQRWVVFPAYSTPGQAPSDWFATLRALI